LPPSSRARRYRVCANIRTVHHRVGCDLRSFGFSHLTPFRVCLRAPYALDLHTPSIPAFRQHSFYCTTRRSATIVRVGSTRCSCTGHTTLCRLLFCFALKPFGPRVCARNAPPGSPSCGSWFIAYTHAFCWFLLSRCAVWTTAIITLRSRRTWTLSWTSFAHAGLNRGVPTIRVCRCTFTRIAVLSPERLLRCVPYRALSPTLPHVTFIAVYLRLLSTRFWFVVLRLPSCLFTTFLLSRSSFYVCCSFRYGWVNTVYLLHFAHQAHFASLHALFCHSCVRMPRSCPRTRRSFRLACSPIGRFMPASSHAQYIAYALPRAWTRLAPPAFYQTFAVCRLFARGQPGRFLVYASLRATRQVHRHRPFKHRFAFAGRLRRHQTRARFGLRTLSFTRFLLIFHFAFFAFLGHTIWTQSSLLVFIYAARHFLLLLPVTSLVCRLPRVTACRCGFTRLVRFGCQSLWTPHRVASR